MTLVTITYGSILGFLPIYAVNRGVADVGLFFTVFAISLLIVRPIFGKLTDILGFDYVVIPSLISVLIGMIALSTATSLGSFLLVGLIYGIGFGGCHSSLQTMAILNTPRERLGAANATFFTGFDLGIGLGSILFGIFAAQLGYQLMYGLTTIAIVAALIYYLIVRRNK
ncbi:MFS transporter [endosymbiont 'TC1' of Trimyema compressum]|uniref:MFS transporter n=1 Tax=endosymbiont 'TC1' of Trimyema compressum TaxID=243899 RepID=UPI000A81A56F|nr:MFS transporter [endosymbiont 'TC1' of Trimyema compressum]